MLRRWRTVLPLLAALTLVVAVAPTPSRAGAPAGGSGDGDALDEVAAEKAVVEEALKNPDAAADAYFATALSRRAAAAASGGSVPASLAILDSPAAINRARRAFKQNLREIARLNRKSGDTLAYGITGSTHLTNAQFERLYPTGRNVVPSGLPNDPSWVCGGLRQWQFTALAAAPLPTRVDYREQGLVTAVKIQGNCGCCVGYANTAAIEASYIYKWRSQGATAANSELSVQDGMNCLPENQCDGADGYEYIERAMCHGVALSSQVPYLAKDDNVCPPNATVPRRLPGIAYYSFVPPDSENLRRAVGVNVVSVGVYANNPFRRHYKAGVLGCKYSSNGALNHEVAIVAYDANEQITKKLKGPVFTVKNSWGTDWGMAGFFKVQAGCTGKGPLGMFTDPWITVPVRG